MPSQRFPLPDEIRRADLEQICAECGDDPTVDEDREPFVCENCSEVYCTGCIEMIGGRCPCDEY